MQAKKSVVIVGAGIQGLAVALLLSETAQVGSIKLYSKEPIDRTTSAVAGGLIEPGFLPEYDDRIGQWFAASRQRLRAMLADPAWYIRRGPVSVLWRQDKGIPAWAGLVDDFTSGPASRPPYLQAWSYTTEVVETPRHLQELARRVTERGVELVERALELGQRLREHRAHRRHHHLLCARLAGLRPLQPQLPDERGGDREADRQRQAAPVAAQWGAETA